MLNVSRLVEVMEAIAPSAGAEEWDNVGLLVGDASWPVKGPLLLAIDLTERVAAEGVEIGAGAVVAYHPVVFNPLNRVAATDPKGRTLLRLIGAGIAVCSPHTALDAAEGGMTDWLIDGVVGEPGGGSDRRALAPQVRVDRAQTHKVVTFLPPADVDRVRAAMSDAGAGAIGAYRQCSFNIPGRGTFFGGEGTSPAVGDAGTLETVEEIRLEMVCGQAALAGAIAALREVHPYEEPAFDVYRLGGEPRLGAGVGRAATLAKPEPLRDVAARVKKSLGVAAVKVAAAGNGAVSRVGVVPGAGGSVLDAAIADGCELFLTGEMRHHEVLGAVERGCSVILAGHTNTERGFLPVLGERIRALEKGFEVRVSERDRTAMEWV